MIHKKEIPIPIYGGYLIIIITDEDIKVSDHYDDLGEHIEIDYGHCLRVNSIQNGKITRSWLAAFKINNEYSKITNGTIAHEAFHATDFVMEYYGLKLVDESSEAYAYVLGWVTNHIYEFFNLYSIEISLKE